VSVLTPSLPERRLLLDECKDSVAAQTVPVAHLVHVDEDREGPAKARNLLALRADTEWLLPVDDDDLLDPDCVRVLLDSSDGDVVYPWCRVEGNPGWTPNRLFRPDTLLRHNFIPVTALVRRDLWLEVGGMDEELRQFEDFDFWRKCLAAGARFVCVPESVVDV
jgi:GT2 family glycosyltransferase